LLFWAVASVGLLDVPLAFSYMWFAFDPDAPRLQEAVNAAINGTAYGTGDWSVVGVRDSAYRRHRILMLTHTTLGAVALLLAFAQLWVERDRVEEGQPSSASKTRALPLS
jgi:hypothetical protein